MNRDELRIYCDLVKKGKPAAMLAITEKNLDEAIKTAGDYGVKYYYVNYYENWYEFWIYRYPHILDVIKAVPNAPRTVYDHWVFGKLFGYDEASIGEFVIRA